MEDVINNLFGILVIVNVNMINYMMLERIGEIIKIANVEKTN